MYVWFSELAEIVSLNNTNQLVFIIVTSRILFEVRIEFLNNILKSFIFQRLIMKGVNVAEFLKT